jgi:cation diffusion facilitator family transporter
MHTQSLQAWQHGHTFLGTRHGRNERRTWIVVALTLAMMVGEIVGGALYGSIALMADGWHMATHAAALGIAAFAYRFARRHAQDPRFSFGTGKVGELAGFASAVVLAVIAAFIGYESIIRLFSPVAIGYREAIAIASLGLVVNLASAWLLRDDHDHHGHGHHHDHGHHHHHNHDHDHDHHHGGGQDHNLRSAYLHVLADALTSVLAIVALLSAGAFGWLWMDAVVGIVGAAVIMVWAIGLIRGAGSVLLDMVPDPTLQADIRRRLETAGDKISDLHLWSVGPGHAAVIASVVSDHPQDPEIYKARIADLAGLSHVTVEVHPCPDHAQATAAA